MSRLSILGLLILLAMLFAYGCGDDDDPVSSKRVPAKILVLEDGGTEDTLYTILSAAGFEVTDGGLYYEYFNTDLSAYDLVILLGGVDYGETIDDSIQQAIKDYVHNGGNLLSIEWLLEEGYYPILQSFLPVMYNEDYSYRADTYLKMANHPITANLPDSFDTPDNGWSLVYMADNSTSLSTNRTVLFNGKEGGPALTIGDYGSGHTIHWGMAGVYDGDDIWSAEVRQIFINVGLFSE